jgi:hypothetical protein
MNMLKYHSLFTREAEEDGEAPGSIQDKGGLARLSAASSQPSTASETALKSNGHEHAAPASLTSNGVVHPKHSTKRKTVFAGGWIDPDTDAHIEHRKTVQKQTRSKVIADMLKERAQDDIVERSQKILVPLIQQTMRSEFRMFKNTFEDRFLAIIARIAYQASYILNLLIEFLTIYPGITGTTLNTMQTKSETAARVHITRRTPQVDEVIRRLKQEMEDKRAWQSSE